MSDERLRELEHRWKATGSVEDEVAWLRERARAAGIAPERIALAVYVGDPAARRLSPPGDAAVPVVGPVHHPEAGVLDPFFLGLARWGQEACVRAAISIMRSVATARGFEPDVLESAHLDRAVAWLADRQPVKANSPWAYSFNGHVSARSMLVLAERDAESAAVQLAIAARYAMALVRPVVIRLAIRRDLGDWALDRARA